MRGQRGNLVVGIFLIALGGWLVVGSLGLPLPGLAQVWPIFPTVLGLAMLARASGARSLDNEAIFVGLGGTLLGGFLFLFTLGLLEWRALAVYWPALPLIVGVAFFALYLAGGMRDVSLLVPAFAAGGLGLLAFPVTLGAVQNPVIRRLIWAVPILVVLLSVVFLFRPISDRTPRVRAVAFPSDAQGPPEDEPVTPEPADQEQEEPSGAEVAGDELPRDQPTDDEG